MIIVTGANGAFGRAAAARLIDRVPAGELILTTRTPQRLADFAARGAQVRLADFDDPASLRTAFAGGTKMLLISTARVGTRVGQHINAINAAVSGRRNAHRVHVDAERGSSPTIPPLVKLDHRATEEHLERCGVALDLPSRQSVFRSHRGCDGARARWPQAGGRTIRAMDVWPLFRAKTVWPARPKCCCSGGTRTALTTSPARS